MTHALVQPAWARTPAQAPSAPPAAPATTTPTAATAPSVLSTLNDDGSRRWLRPRPSPGRFLSARRSVAWALIAVFTLLPYVQIRGRQAFLLDLPSRRFTLFGYTFLPTDTVLLALLGIGVFVLIFLLTALLGRVWCGWACPQTVYMEFVYRPLERFFDGVPGRPAKNWFQRTGFGKIAKHGAYLVVSLYLAHTFLAYFVGVERLAQWVQQSPLRHPTPFLIMAIVTALMMFDFAVFREQTCLVACPYGRFQSVLLDRHSLVVAYDRSRGEPRSRKRRDVSLPVVEARAGDCVDCSLCVTTCPTGIDIRNGLQMECIHCAQCIDACDAVMAKIGRPRGLIRYSSQAAMETQRWSMLRSRVIVYPAVLAVVASLFTYLLLTRGPAYVAVLRGIGAPFSALPSGEISNPVRVRIVNRREQAATYELTAVNGSTHLIAEGLPVTVGPGQTVTLAASLLAPRDAFQHGALDAALRVSDDQGFVKDVPYRMMGPTHDARPASPDATAGSGGVP